MGKEPSLSVFFWFFSLHRAEKVDWTSLSSRPRCKLMKPFRESYKFFNDHFFRVAIDRTGPSFSLTNLGIPSSPCTRPISWPCRSRSTGTTWRTGRSFYSAKDLMTLKKRASRSPAPILARAIAEVALLAAAWSEPSMLAKETTLPTPMVTLDSLDNLPVRADIDAGGSAAKHPVEEGVLESPERLFKRMVTTGTKVGSVGDFGFAGASDNSWGEIMASQPPSPSIWTLSFPIGEMVDERVATLFDRHKAKELGLPRALEVIQRYAGYLLALS
ncbi:hypothetical protein CR513_49677, partial [Mucuna pruriens]